MKIKKGIDLTKYGFFAVEDEDTLEPDGTFEYYINTTGDRQFYYFIVDEYRELKILSSPPAFGRGRPTNIGDVLLKMFMDDCFESSEVKNG